MKAIRTAWNHIRRSPYQALAAIFIITQTFFVITSFIYVFAGSAVTIHYFESLPQVAAFFKTDTDQSTIDSVKKQIMDSGKAAQVTFISKQEALQKYRKQNADDPLLLELVTEDVLPASLEISAVNIDDLKDIAQVLKSSPAVEDVLFPADIISNLKTWTNALRRIGVIFMGVMTLDSIFLMVIIIGIKISQKKEEVEIMRLLSATNWYIRWPFIFEGMFYCLVGATIGWILSTGVLLYATPFLKSFLRDVPLFPLPMLFLAGIFAVELVIAVLLGWFSSLLAVLRYLK